MTIFVGKMVQDNETIIFNNITSSYSITCIAVNAKPDVDLSLYDTNTLLPLSNNITNNSITGFCEQEDLCTRILQVNFAFYDRSFINMTSLTCAAKSKDPMVDLSLQISRNVSVILPNTSNFIYLFKHIYIKINLRAILAQLKKTCSIQ
jgi:hypothetical protein